MRDQCNELKIVSAINAQQITTADITGQTVDRKGYDSLTYVVSVGAEGDTLSGSVKLDLKLFEGTTTSPTTPVAGVDIIVPEDQDPLVVLAPTSGGIVCTIDAAAEAPVLIKVGYKGAKRYSTVQADQTGLTVGFPIAAIAVLGDPALSPVDN